MWVDLTYLSMDKQVKRSDSKDVKESTKPEVKANPDSAIDLATSTETIVPEANSTASSTVRDDVAEVIDQSKRNNKRNKSKGGSGKRQNNSDVSKPESKQKVVSSTISKTVKNEFSNFNSLALKSKLQTTGWIDRVDGQSIEAQLQELFSSMGINSATLLSRRGDLLKNFSDWAALLKTRINRSKDVFVLDHPEADKSISSEDIFNSFFKQRRPFTKVVGGVPRINAMALPDVAYNLKLLNISTNGHSPNLDNVERKYAAYGTLVQELTTNNGYQTRRVRLASDQPSSGRNYLNSTPGKILVPRIPSTNNNGIRIDQQNSSTSGNKISWFEVNLFPASDISIEGPINMSLELNNKAKFFTKLLRIIQDEAVNYAKKQSSGDNAWFSPAYLIEDETTLAATINGFADLKTMLYIINDAINGAFKSQLLKASKVGTPDSTYVGITGKSTYIKNQYASQFARVWAKFKNIPMHRDVIEKWHQNKSWSKFKPSDLYDHDNMLQIPVFLLGRTGGSYYHTDYVMKEFSNTDDISILKPDIPQLLSALTVSVQTLDKAQYAIPQGDAYALFLQSIIAHMSLSSFIRVNKSNQKYTMDGDTFDTTTALLNSNQVATKYIDLVDNPDFNLEGNVRIPSKVIKYQVGLNGSPVDPDTIGKGTINNANNTTITSDYAGTNNQFGDLTISYHTMTGFMAGFMDMIVTAATQGHFDAWNVVLDAVTPYFARLSEIAPKSDALMFGDLISPVAINNLPEPITAEPQFSKEQNVDFYYSAATLVTSGGFTYTPTRMNVMSKADFTALSAYPYKAIGSRWVMIDKDGKADRDVNKDNNLVIIQSTTNNKNLWYRDTKKANHYLVTWSVIRFNELLNCTQTKGTGNKIFPIYIGAHAGEMFYDNVNVFAKGSAFVKVDQLNPRGLLANTTDEYNVTSIPGAFDQLVYTQIVENIQKFNADTQVFTPNVWYFLHAVVPEATQRTFMMYTVMTNYNNNSYVNVTENVVQTIFSRWDIHGDYVPATTFSNL